MSSRTFTNPAKTSNTPSAALTPLTMRQRPTVKPSRITSRERTPATLLSLAAMEPASGLPEPLSTQMASNLGHDFAHVRVHSGKASMAAADLLGARAYTLGRDIHLGSAAMTLGRSDRKRLLAHESIHTVQQGARSVRPTVDLAVSRLNDTAEHEAQALADAVEHGASPSLALRDRVFGSSSPRIQRAVAPHIQRDLKGEHKTADGKFNLNLKTESHAGAQSGMKGTIKFTASGTAPDSKSIRLLQVVRTENLSTGKELKWSGTEADRNKVQTTEDTAKNIQPGFFVDHSAAAASPRATKADAAVSPFYRDYWPNAGSSQDGSKAGKTVNEASLWDYPRTNAKIRFTFETAAKATDSSYIYATLSWGFTVSDPAKGTVGSEHESAALFPSATLGAAVSAFNEFYKNPGASTAPTK